MIIRSQISLTFVGIICFAIISAADTSKDSPVIAVYERIAPSVVLVSVQGLVADEETSSLVEVRSTGTGFAVQPGLVVTNYHVIENARRIEVTLSDESSAMASVLGTSPEHDIALLRVPFSETRLPPVTAGSTRGIQVGQKVVAVGNPLGFQNSVSVGIISGLYRDVPKLVIGSSLIQLTAAINPGQSGGPLLDMEGRVIGMTTGRVSEAEGIGFAIPIDLINRTIPDLKQMGHSFRPDIGFKGVTIDPDLARLFELPTQRGVLIQEVTEGSLAEEIGLMAGERRVHLGGLDFILGGDIIAGFDGEFIRGTSDLSTRLVSASPGQKVVLSVFGPSGKRQLTLVIPEMRHHP